MDINKLNRFLAFLYPIAFALPDFSINLSVINLRFDDLIIYMIFFINLKCILLFYTRLEYGKFFRIQLFLLFYIYISLSFVFIFQNNDLLSMYEVIRTVGSIPYLFVLPFLLCNSQYRKMIYLGAFIGGGVYLFSIYLNYQSIMKEGFVAETSASLKKNVSFSSLNPNAVSSIAVLFGWINLLSFAERNKKYNLIMAGALFLIPLVFFARSLGFSLLIVLIVFFYLRKNKSIIFLLSSSLILLIFISIFLSLVNVDLLNNAVDIDVKTGDGFSNRYTLWEQGLHLFGMSPIFGHGFGLENAVYIKYFAGHQSHQIFLRYAIELGVIGLIPFIYSVVYLINSIYKKYTFNSELIYLYQLCLFLTFFIADLTGQLLYFNKYAFLVFSLATFTTRKNKGY